MRRACAMILVVLFFLNGCSPVLPTSGMQTATPGLVVSSSSPLAQIESPLPTRTPSIIVPSQSITISQSVMPTVTPLTQPTNMSTSEIGPVSGDMKIGRNVISDGTCVYYSKDSSIYQRSIKTGKDSLLVKDIGVNNRLMLDSAGNLYCLAHRYDEESSEPIRTLYKIVKKKREVIISNVGYGDILRANDTIIYYYKEGFNDKSNDGECEIHLFDRNKRSDTVIYRLGYYDSFTFVGNTLYHISNDGFWSYDCVTGTESLIVGGLSKDSYAVLNDDFFACRSQNDPASTLVLDLETMKKMNIIFPVRFDGTPFIFPVDGGLVISPISGDRLLFFDFNSQKVRDVDIKNNGSIEAVTAYGDRIIVYSDMVDEDFQFYNGEIWSYDLKTDTAVLIKKYPKVSTYLGPVALLEVSGGYLWGYETACGDDSNGNWYSFSCKLP